MSTCPKLYEWHQSNSDFALYFNEKLPVKANAHRNARFNRLQGFLCWSVTNNRTNIKYYTTLILTET